MTLGRERQILSARKSVGDAGEELASQFLLRKGFRILERNYRTRKGEIDIIAQKGRTLVFIEVKTDRTGNFGPPQTWVTPRKQRQLARLAQGYLQERDFTKVDLRFDVIGIRLEKGEPEIEHLESAFWISDNINR